MLTDEVEQELGGWADNNHLVRVHDDARWVELAIRVGATSKVCSTLASGPTPRTSRKLSEPAGPWSRTWSSLSAKPGCARGI